jgi:hypothetical protein
MAKKPAPKKRKAHRVGKKSVVMLVALPQDPAEREKMLFSMLCELDPGSIKITAAIEALSLKTGLAVSSLKRYLGKHEWRVRWKAHWDKKKTAVNLEEVDKGIAQILLRRDQDNKEVPLSEMSSRLKDLAFCVIGTNADMVKSCSAMITLYTQKANRVIEKWKEHGGIGSISKTDQEMIEMYMTKAKGFYMLVQDYMKPQALLSMLDQIGMKEALGVIPDGVDPSAFTTSALLKKLERLALPSGEGLTETIGNDRLIKDVEYEVVKDMPDVPDVDARTVRDDENQINVDRPERKKKE